MLSGAQFHTLTCLSKILSSVPEGGEAAGLLNAELERSPGRIDYVNPPVISALKAALPVLERAMASSPGEETVRAFKKLEMIASLRTSSQTLPAVLDPARLQRARDLARPRSESPAVRYVERMIRSEVGASRPARVFLFNGEILHRGRWPELLDFLSKHFGCEVTRGTLEELFSLPLENYRVATVTILQDVDRPVRIVGEIRNANKRVGFVGMKVPSVPPLGSPWVAKVEVINVDPKHQRLGIGSRLHVRAARFLHDRGVHAMDADAMEDAGLFCVFNGFRVDRAIYEDVVAEFVEDMRRAEVEVTEDLIRTQLLHPDANLAELAALKDIKGRGIGREFLKGLFSKRYLPVRFGLSPDNMSWLRLLSNLHRDGPSRKIAPLEWESLQPATRERLISNVDFVGGNVPNLMSSDREHAFHLLERLTNWVQRFSLLLFFPPAMQGPMLEEMREEIEDNMAAAQDVLKMIAADTSSPLFSHFRHLMDPGKDEGINRGDSTNNGLPMAATLLAAEKREFLRLPSVLRAFFDDLVTRDY